MGSHDDKKPAYVPKDFDPPRTNTVRTTTTSSRTADGNSGTHASHSTITLKKVDIDKHKRKKAPSEDNSGTKKRKQSIKAIGKNDITRESAAVFPAADASPVPVVFDEGEAPPKKKRKTAKGKRTRCRIDGCQKLPHSQIVTFGGNTTKRPAINEVSILSTEEEAVMQQIRRIAWGGYYEGLIALKFGRSIPTTNLVDWNSIETIAEEILYNNEPKAVMAAMTPGGEGRTNYPRIRSVTPPPPTTHTTTWTTTTTTTTTPTRQSQSPQRAVEIASDVIDQSTLAPLTHHMNLCLKGFSNTQQRERDLEQDYMVQKNTKYQSLIVGSEVMLEGKQDGNRYQAKVLAIPVKSIPNIFRLKFKDDDKTVLHDMAITNFSIIEESAKVVVTNIKSLPIISSSSRNASSNSYDCSDCDSFSQDSIAHKIMTAQEEEV